MPLSDSRRIVFRRFVQVGLPHTKATPIAYSGKTASISAQRPINSSHLWLAQVMGLKQGKPNIICEDFSLRRLQTKHRDLKIRIDAIPIGST